MIATNPYSTFRKHLTKIRFDPKRNPENDEGATRNSRKNLFLYLAKKKRGKMGN